MVRRFCEYTKIHRLIHLKWMNTLHVSQYISQSSYKKKNERGKQQELWTRVIPSFTRVFVMHVHSLPPCFMSEDNSGKDSSDVHTCSLSRWSQAPVQPSHLLSPQGNSIWWDLMVAKSRFLVGHSMFGLRLPGLEFTRKFFACCYL